MRQQMQEEVVVPDAGLAAGHAEVDMEAKDRHALDQPAIPVDKLVIALRRGDATVGIAGEGIASGGREAEAQLVADLVEPSETALEIPLDFMRIGALRGGDLDRTLKELFVEVLPVGPRHQHFLGAGGEIERDRINELQLDLCAESELATRAER